jgi:hypothetical protein
MEASTPHRGHGGHEHLKGLPVGLLGPPALIRHQMVERSRAPHRTLRSWLPEGTER